MKSFKLPLKNKIVIQQVETNESFKKICLDLRNDTVTIDPSLSFYVENREAGIELGGKVYMKEYEALSIELENIAAIRIASSGQKSLEITHLWVHPRWQKKGLGTKLMNTVFDLCVSSLGYIPSFNLECTGNVTHEDDYYFMDISDQATFYRKFGFRVIDRTKYPTYIKMASPATVLSNKEVSSNCNFNSNNNVRINKELNYSKLAA
jgi:GNAT superfamily N-acetyltransferase